MFLRYDTSAANCVKSMSDRSSSKLASAIRCLSNKRADIQVTYTQLTEGQTFKFGWGDPLEVNGRVVANGKDYDFRYENSFARVPWGDPIFNITSQQFYLHMDFENNSFEQN